MDLWSDGRSSLSRVLGFKDFVGICFYNLFRAGKKGLSFFIIFLIEKLLLTLEIFVFFRK